MRYNYTGNYHTGRSHQLTKQTDNNNNTYCNKTTTRWQTAGTQTDRQTHTHTDSEPITGGGLSRFHDEEEEEEEEEEERSSL